MFTDVDLLRCFKQSEKIYRDYFIRRCLISEFKYDSEDLFNAFTFYLINGGGEPFSNYLRRNDFCSKLNGSSFFTNAIKCGIEWGAEDFLIEMLNGRQPGDLIGVIIELKEKQMATQKLEAKLKKIIQDASYSDLEACPFEIIQRCTCKKSPQDVLKIIKLLRDIYDERSHKSSHFLSNHHHLYLLLSNISPFDKEFQSIDLTILGEDDPLRLHCQTVLGSNLQGVISTIQSDDGV